MRDLLVLVVVMLLRLSQLNRLVEIVELVELLLAVCENILDADQGSQSLILNFKTFLVFLCFIFAKCVDSLEKLVSIGLIKL